MTVAEPLKQERKVYDQQRDRLLMESQGRFALICGDELLGVFDTYADALQVGYDKRGLGDFMVKRIEAAERVHLV